MLLQKPGHREASASDCGPEALLINTSNPAFTAASATLPPMCPAPMNPMAVTSVTGPG